MTEPSPSAAPSSRAAPLAQFLRQTDPRVGLALWLEDFADGPRPTDAAAFEAQLQCAISALDEGINTQLNAIIHHPQLQALEAAWRGLWYLVAQADGARNVKIKLLDISWSEVCKDLSRALDFDQSQLFHKIYSAEFGTAGGEPFGALLGVYELSHRPTERNPCDDIAALERLCQICAAAFAPFVAGAAPELLGLEDFGQLRLPANLSALFQGVEYRRWRALCARPDCRFVGLTLPRVLLRGSYADRPGSYKGVYFHERPGTGRSNQLWGNACFAFGGILLREFIQVGWFGHIRGVPRDHVGGGLVANLPAPHFVAEPLAERARPSVDLVVTDSLERDLSSLGLIALCQSYGAPLATFYSNPSLHHIAIGKSDATALNARLASMLQHVLCGSRIAHYIKVMIRDKIGSFLTAAQCEDFVRKWLLTYTTGRSDLDWEAQARYPLREAKISVREHPARPEHFICVIHLVPHYQADQMVSELELVTELSAAGRAA